MITIIVLIIASIFVIGAWVEYIENPVTCNVSAPLVAWLGTSAIIIFIIFNYFN